MIPITPLHDRTVLINAHSIERIEQVPETVLVLTGGRRMVVVDLAQDVVKRLQRVRTSVLAMATNGSIPRRTGDDAIQADVESPVVGIADPRFRRPDQPTTEESDRAMSSTNLLHRGQIALDRIMASIARCRWLIEQRSVDTRYDQELAKAIGTIDDLTDTLHPIQASGATTYMAELLGGCRDQLNMLLQSQAEIPVRDADDALRIVHGIIRKTRAVWARIAADTSWAAITHSLEQPERPKLELCSD